MERCLEFGSKRRVCRLFLCEGEMPLYNFDHNFLGDRQLKKSSTCRTFSDLSDQIFCSKSVLGSGSFFAQGLICGQFLGLNPRLLVFIVQKFDMSNFAEGVSPVVELFVLFTLP